MQSNIILRQNGTIVCSCRKRKQVMGLRKMRLCKAWDEQNNSLHKNEITRNGKFTRMTPTPPTPPPLTLTLPNYITHVPCWGKSKLELCTKQVRRQNPHSRLYLGIHDPWPAVSTPLGWTKCSQVAMISLENYVMGSRWLHAISKYSTTLNLFHLQLCNGQKNESYTSYHDLVSLIKTN